jgi:hypothetical protein
MALHADSVAQNRAARVGASGVDGKNSYSSILFSIVPGKLIDQRALPCPGSARYSDNSRFACVGEESFEEFLPADRTVLDRSNGARKRARIAGAEMFDRCLDGLVQTASVKQAIALLPISQHVILSAVVTLQLKAAPFQSCAAND